MARTVPRQGRREVEAEPYTILARWYDEVMDHIDYRKWASFIQKIVKRHRRIYKTAVDYACGTGSLAYHLSGYGYEVIGVDGSRDMVEEAQRIKPKRGRMLSFQVGDLREPPDLPQRELAVCLYDSINYVMHKKYVRSFLRGVHRTLVKGGMLIMDLSTIRNSREHFSGYEMDEHVTDCYYKRNSYFDSEQQIQHNEFRIYPDDEGVVYLEHHRQRIWPVGEITALMKEEKFKVLAVYHEQTLKPGGEDSDRVHIVAEPV